MPSASRSAGAAEGEVFDGAFEAGDVDDFAYVVLVFDEDEDAVEHVLEDGLGAEADGDAYDSGRGEQRLVGDAEDVENLEEDDEAEDAIGGGADDGGHGAELGCAVEVAYLVVGAPAQALDEEEHQLMEDEDDEENEDEFGEFVLNDVDDVVVPAVLDGPDHS